MKKSKYFTAGHNYSKRQNIIGLLKGNGNGKSILLNGHVDTMPAGDESLWKYPPFAARIVGSKLYGNGAADMKAGVAAMIMAVKLIKNNKFGIVNNSAYY